MTSNDHSRQSWLPCLFLAAFALLSLVVGFWYWSVISKALFWFFALPWEATIWPWASRISKAVGFIAAGLWVYFNFVKSRTYHPRMELTCSGTIIGCDAERRLFVPRLTLKHIGKSKISLEQQGSGFTLHFSEGLGPDAARAEWETDQKWYGVFSRHRWIEPEESIFHETDAFVVPSWAAAVKLEARILGEFAPSFERNR